VHDRYGAQLSTSHSLSNRGNTDMGDQCRETIRANGITSSLRRGKRGATRAAAGAMCRTRELSTAHGLLGLVISMFAILAGATTHAQSASSASDRRAAERATTAYRDAWISNNPELVMATLTSDAVIYPSNLKPIVGADAIRRFWFPSGQSTRVVAMELTIDGLTIDTDTAIVSGVGLLTFVTTANGDNTPPRSQSSWFVNILRRQSDGGWLIWRRMWGDTRN